MKSVMRYVSKLSKTLWDGQQLVSGIGCQPETAFDEFLSTKLLHHKDGGVMFYHMVQSFLKGADVVPKFHFTVFSSSNLFVQQYFKCLFHHYLMLI